jgi:hypothetical protein
LIKVASGGIESKRRQGMNEAGIEKGREETREELERVREEFEAYRGRSEGRRDLPEELWMKAVGLLERYPASRVCRELRLNSKRLNTKRYGEGATGRAAIRVGGERNRGRGSKSGAEFLQLSAGQIATASGVTVSKKEKGRGHGAVWEAPADSSCSITIERTDGSRLTVRSAGSQAVIEAICTQFLTEAR